MVIPKIDSFFPRLRRQSSMTENQNIESEPIDNQAPSLNYENDTLPSPTLSDVLSTTLSRTASKRNRSDGSETIEESKRQNLNTSALENSDNVDMFLDDSKSAKIADKSTTSTTFDQLEASFEKNTPHWVPLMMRSFDSLSLDLKSKMDCLSEDVKTISSKFESFSADISKRLDYLEIESNSTKEKQAEIS